jgi:hypothetical protein
MKVPQYRRIYKSDFNEDEQSLVEKMSLSINNGFDVLYDLINNKLTLKDNFNGTVKDITLTLSSSGIPLENNSFALDTQNRIIGVQVLRAVNLTDNTVFPSQAPFISFTQTERGVTINNLTGLQSGYKWQLTVFAYGS